VDTFRRRVVCARAFTQGTAGSANGKTHKTRCSSTPTSQDSRAHTSGGSREVSGNGQTGDLLWGVPAGIRQSLSIAEWTRDVLWKGRGGSREARGDSRQGPAGAT